MCHTCIAQARVHMCEFVCVCDCARVCVSTFVCVYVCIRNTEACVIKAAVPSNPPELPKLPYQAGTLVLMTCCGLQSMGTAIVDGVASQIRTDYTTLHHEEQHDSTARSLARLLTSSLAGSSPSPRL